MHFPKYLIKVIGSQGALWGEGYELEHTVTNPDVVTDHYDE